MSFITTAMAPQSPSVQDQVEEARPITVGGEERLDQAVRVLAPEFYDDAIMTYMYCNVADDEARHDLIRRTMRLMVITALLTHGIVIEVDGWSSVGVLVPPGLNLDNIVTLARAGAIPHALKVGFKATKRLLSYTGAVEKVKESLLTPEEKDRLWYCFIVATVSSRRRQGLASLVVQEMQRRAIADGNRCLWLEASSVASRKTYEKQGFVVVGGEMVFGKGMVGRDGRLKKDGEGALVWPMVWRPPKKTTPLGGVR